MVDIRRTPTNQQATKDVLAHGKECDVCQRWAADGRELYDLRCLDGWILIQEMLKTTK